MINPTGAGKFAWVGEAGNGFWQIETKDRAFRTLYHAKITAELECDEINAASDARMESFRKRIVEAIPSNWCDSLLTGEKAALKGPGPWGCPDIERLLNAIRRAVKDVPL